MYVESIGNILSIDKDRNSLNISNKKPNILYDLSYDETDFLSYDYIDNFNHCENGAIKMLKNAEDSSNDRIVNDPSNIIEGSDKIDDSNDNNFNIDNDKRISDVSSQMSVKDQCDNKNKDYSKQTCTENECMIMINPLMESNLSNTAKTIEEIWDQHLSWPEMGDIKKNKRNEKEKLPFAITASKWRKYHQKLRLDKEKKELESKEKASKRKITKEEDEIKKQKKKKEREIKKKERERKNEEKKEN